LVTLPQNNLTYPVLVSTEKGGNGSGFYLSTDNAMYLVTACHVLFKDSLELYPGTTRLTSLTSDFTSKAHFEVDSTRLLASGALKKHPTADVAVCKIANIPSATDRKIELLDGIRQAGAGFPPSALVMGLSALGTRRIQEVTISNDVFLFSYPTTLGRETQIDRHKPLLRKGIVAGKTDDGRLVIDCPVYFGNSGGLVIEVSIAPAGATFMGIGIATEMVPFVEELWSKQFKTQTGVRYENSGYTVVEPMDRIFDLL
jgi:hypothetical protein